jgi:hypothetical protein
LGINILRRDSRSLHRVQGLSDFFEVCDYSSFGIKGAFGLRSCWKRVDVEFLGSAWVDLEVQSSGHWVFPALPISYVFLTGERGLTMG